LIAEGLEQLDSARLIAHGQAQSQQLALFLITGSASRQLGFQLFAAAFQGFLLGVGRSTAGLPLAPPPAGAKRCSDGQAKQAKLTQPFGARIRGWVERTQGHKTAAGCLSKTPGFVPVSKIAKFSTTPA
jgi:hypothetical protein